MLLYLILFLSLFFNSFASNVQNLSSLTSNLLSLSQASSNSYTEFQLGKYKIILTIKDILNQPSDAIVNAANSGCLGGGGIDGVISRAGGDSKTKPNEHTTLYDLRVALPQMAGSSDRCPLADARITRGGWLQYPYKDQKIGANNSREQFNYVIHAVGPSCPTKEVTKHEKKTLANTYINVLKRVDAFNKNPKDANYAEFPKIDTSNLGENYQIRSLSFPTISTGIFGCETKQTADKVVKKVCKFLKNKPDLDIKQINFVFWNPGDQSKAKEDYDFYKKAFTKYLV